ncbi:D-alanine--D-alanine ligase family protein [Microbacterium sp. JB110]|uniref:D-alanine--D-alanine ligase family protein n=1 Tax=Microbacterium sp. JB110 TaxID=2024477 RepID=UPI000B3606E3|nr:D-alanine--D-alanine ligase family protein [Microbacterium sp. JB110]RCS62168.1 D-alanine--D-alanine ligase [Microbacterium sp. JB110]
MASTTVAVLFGGRSSEHSISSATAGGVLGAIDREKFNVIPVGITREGIFVLEQDDPARFALDAEKLPEVVDNGTRVLWPLPGSGRELRALLEDGTVTSLGTVDVVLPILHGVHGEDGTIQGFFDTLEIPYAGGGVIDSAIAMDKDVTKVVLQAAGIPVTPWLTVRRRRWEHGEATVRAEADALGYPLFVKPARAGSSVGVSKAHGPDELAEAMRVALAEDDKVLIETAIVGREIEVAVLEGRDGAEPRVSLPGEIVLTTREFYDFEGKYLGGDGAEVVCPAVLTEEQTATIRAFGARVFEALECRGLARVDVFLTDAGDVIVNEPNTMPGFTPISMYPKCWIASGVSYAQLITELIELGLGRA